MQNVETLYKLLGVAANCSDDELRGAYCRAILASQPDSNSNTVEAATDLARSLNLAYAELKEHRTISRDSSGCVGNGCVAKGFDGTFRLVLEGSATDIRDIADRKETFRSAWETFQQRPDDPLCALKLIHIAFRAGQQDSIHHLLLDPLLIDSAAALPAIPEAEDGCATLIDWAEILRRDGKLSESIQVLEDALATGEATFRIKDHLRKLHYSLAQHCDPTTSDRATPDTRIIHLNRILELGFDAGYIHKFLAEAHHDQGDDVRAREHLTRAYQLDPDLQGAVRISRALGFNRNQTTTKATAEPSNQYKFSKPAQIASPSEICEWALLEDWGTILDRAYPADYSPHLLPAARSTLNEIALSLRDCSDKQCLPALVNLLDSIYWDVRLSALKSLAKIGDESTMTLIENLRWGSTSQAYQEMCLGYMRARLRAAADSALPLPELISRAKRLINKAMKFGAHICYGEARFILERALECAALKDASRVETTILLAESCAAMLDHLTAVNLVRPVLSAIPSNTRTDVVDKLIGWTRNALFGKDYCQRDDDLYVLSLSLPMEQIEAAKTCDCLLWNLKRLAGSLELLGEGETAMWIRSLIRTEAPGTHYVEEDRGEQYVCDVYLSPTLREYVTYVSERIRGDTVLRLQRIMGAPREPQGIDLG